MPRDEMIDYIIDSANDFEDLTSEDNYNLLCKLNNMTNDELEKEVDFYDELYIK